MAAGDYIIFPGDASWRIGVARGGKLELRETTAAGAASALRELGYSGQGATLAIPGAWCFVASIDTSDLRRGDRSAMIYRLEEKLPIAAEEFVADFAIGSAGRALGVAVLTAKVRPIIDALEQDGIEVASITPVPLLAISDVEMSDALRVFEISQNDSVDLVGMRGDEIVAMSHWPNDQQHIQLGLGLIELEHGAKPNVLKVEASVPQGDKPIRIELRRDALAARDRLRAHRRAIDASLAAAAIFLLAIAAACFLRAARFERSIRASHAQLAEDFHHVFPGWETPAIVKAVIQSERRKLASQGVSRVDFAGLSALRTMQNVLGALPAQPRFSFDRMVFTDATFELAGRAAGVESLSAIRSSAQQNGWTLAQPQAHRDGDGFWSFTIHGSRGGSVASRENLQP